MQATTRYIVQEVHNFGGFFGGDTVTLSAAPLGQPDAPQTITIDERALVNVPNRYQITAGMLLALDMQGERVDRAELLGAASHAELRAALGAPQPAAPLLAPTILSYCCEHCAYWLAGAPTPDGCPRCGKS